MSGELYRVLAREMSGISNSLGSFAGQIETYRLNEAVQRNQIVMGAALKNLDIMISDSAKQSIKVLSKANLRFLTEQIKIISSINMPELFKSVQPLMNKEFLQNYNNALASLKGYNLTEISRIWGIAVNTHNYSLATMTKAIQNTINRIDWSQGVSIDELSERAADRYIAEESEKQDEADSPKSSGKTYDRWNIIKDIRDTISFILTVIGFVMSFHSSKSYVPPNTYINLSEVKNVYNINANIDTIEWMNALGYRVINRDNVMPRIKPDCSSEVTGHLYIGQIVQIIDKYKKWIEVIWNDAEGNECSGWVQNYKVTKFRKKEGRIKKH